MRPLAVGGFTAVELERRLRRRHAADSVRFEVVGLTGNHIKDLVTTTLGGTRRGVYGAKITMGTNRNLVRQLSLKMLPDDALRGFLFRRKIRVYYQLAMGRGDIAEWLVGTFLWGLPERGIDGGVETWDVKCSDSGQILDYQGVGPKGFEAAKDERATDALVRAFNRAGFPDTSGVVPSDELLDEPKTWAVSTPRKYRPLIRAHGSNAWVPESEYRRSKWMDVTTDLCDAAGYYPPHFSVDDRPLAFAPEDLATATPSFVLDAHSDGVLHVDVSTNHRIEDIANRVIVQARNQKGIYNTVVVDANKELPGHPYSEAVIGFYADAILDESTASSEKAMRRRGLRHLHERASTFQTVKAKIMPWPTLDPYDVLGLQYTSDAEFDVVRPLHLIGFDWDLFESVIDLELQRLWTAT